MNRHLCTFIALAGAAAPALAQSPPPFSPVLFGVIDVNLRAVKNGSARLYKSQGTDGLSSSRLGFRGQEDLGDGFKAAFWLEAPVSADSGTANTTRFWNRRSTVALLHPTWGELRAGRDNTPAKNAFDLYDPFGTNGLGEIVGNGTTLGIISTLGSGSNTLTRSDNQVSYFTPAGLGGAYAHVAVAPSEGAPGNRYTSGRVGYADKPFDVSVVYSETKVASGDKLKLLLVGGFYDFSAVKLTGEVLQSRYSSAAGGPRKQTVYQLGAFIPNGRHIFRVDAIHGDMDGGAPGSGFGDRDDANQFSAGYEYQLSKRSSLYTVASALRNRGTSRLTIAAGSPGMKPGQTSRGVDLGIRHSF